MNELNLFIENNNISTNKQIILRRMYENNKNLLKNVNINFINSDYFDRLDFNLLQAIVSLDESVQLSFLEITDNKRELFFQIINRFSKQYYQFPYINSLLINFNNSKFDKFLNNINIETLTEEDFLKINYILTAKENELNIQTINELRNIEIILQQKIKISKNNNNLDEYKNYMLINKINLSISEVKLICQKYCYDLEHFHIDSPIIMILKCLKNIVLSNSFEDVNNLINSLNIKKTTYPDFQTLCQNLYEEEFNSVLFNPNGKDYTIHEGCKIIDAGLEFNMLVRANGVFSDKNTTLTPIEYWNNNIRDSLSFSNSLLSNNYLRNVSFFEEDGYVIGFSNIPKNSLVQCCMGDNATIHTRKKTLDVRSYDDEREIHPNTGDGCGQQFRPLPEMIKHGAGEYQEVTLERFYYEDDNEFRIQPSYVVYFKNSEDYKDSSDFKKVFDAAKSFDIPIVVIDIKMVLLNEEKEIETLLFNEMSIDNIIDAISRYSNLIHSFQANRTKNILPDTFKIEEPLTSINNMLSNYLLFLEQKNYDESFYQDLFDKLMILNDEKNCIDIGILIKLKHKHNLTANFEKYNEIIYGITYKLHHKKINSQYLFEETEKAFDYILESNLELTNDVYNNSKINSIVKSCKINNVTLTQEIISFSWEEYKLYLEKDRTIKKLNDFPTEDSINKLFDLFSHQELKKILQPIIDKIIFERKIYLIEIIKRKLKEQNLEEKFVIEYEKTGDAFDDFCNFEWEEDWTYEWEDETTPPKKI